MKWCDLDCPEASWPESKDLSGACRTFQALFCRKLGRAVQKNGLCQCPEEGTELPDELQP
jgi:hypothetical protein